MDSDLATACVSFLRESGVQLTPGLSSNELRDVERHHDFVFNEDHAAFLSLAVPLGSGWVDWRQPDDDLRRRLEWPMDGLLFDVQHNAFWPRSWGPRPATETDALVEARRNLQGWPTLVPVYSHRYLPAAPAPSGAPVFSVHQADVIHYGTDLHDYFLREFGGRRTAIESVNHPVEPWSLLALGHDRHNL